MRHTVTTANQVHVQETSTFAVKLLMVTFRLSLILTLAISLLIGIWAFAALAGGTIEAGGVLGLIKSWFLAVTGA